MNARLVALSDLFRQSEDNTRQMQETIKEINTHLRNIDASIHALMVLLQDKMKKDLKEKEKTSASEESSPTPCPSSPTPCPSDILSPQGLDQAGSQPMGSKVQSNQGTGGTTMAQFPDGAKEITSQAPVLEANQVSVEESMQQVSVLLQEIQPVTEDLTIIQIEAFVQEFTKVVGDLTLTSHQKFQAFSDKSEFCRACVTIWKEKNRGNYNFEEFMEDFLEDHRRCSPKRNLNNLSLLSCRQTGSLVEYFENFTLRLQLADAAYRNDQIALDLFESGLDNRFKKKLVFKKRENYHESYNELLCSELVAAGRKAEKGPYELPAPSEGMKRSTNSSSRKRNRPVKESENSGQLTNWSNREQKGPCNKPINLQGTAFSPQESEPTTPDISTDDELINSCPSTLDGTTATAPVKEEEKLFMVSLEDATALAFNRGSTLFSMQSFPMYLVTLAEQRFRALVHTGVSFNTIHPRVVERTGITPYATGPEESIMIGEDVEATQAVRLNLTLMDGRKIVAVFAVIKSPFDFIFRVQLVDQVGLFIAPDGFHAEIEIEANIPEFLSHSSPQMV